LAESDKLRYAEIVVNRPVDKAFHYAVPENLREKIAIGMRVLVPFGHSNTAGYVVGFVDTPEVELVRIKEIIKALDNEPLIDKNLMELARWISRYYLCSLGETLEAILPAAVRKTRVPLLKCAEPTIHGSKLRQKIDELKEKHPKQAKVLEILVRESGKPVPLTISRLKRLAGLSESPVKSLEKRGLVRIFKSELPLGDIPYEQTPQWQDKPIEEYSEPQKLALAQIKKQLESEEFGVFLLHGVSGSGKTEIYIQAIHEVVRRGRQAIVLVPEVALTPQTVGRFVRHFPNVALLHSYQSASERHWYWAKARRGLVQVAIGPRSAVFAPLPKLGLIVIDEEHETTFKQETTPRYHARDVAIMRAQGLGIPVVLGSATPDLVTFQNAKSGKYALAEMPERVTPAKPPEIDIIDMVRESFEQMKLKKRRVRTLISRHLEYLVSEALKRNEQTVLFLNRRGYATHFLCPRCKFVLKCSNCDITLTYHKHTRRALCHYCGEYKAVPEACPECLLPNIEQVGAGTERIEEELGEKFPGARVVRMDSDTMRGRGAYSTVLHKFKRGEIDILVGTQMLAKGLDFPHVTVVGVLNADVVLNFPDYRSRERTFQLLVQVSGRAGRGERRGRVVIQTSRPDDFCIRAAASLDYEKFAEKELSFRKTLRYPPFGRLLQVTTQSPEERAAFEKGREIARALQEVSSHPVQVLGPAPAPISKIRGNYRWHILVKAPNAKTLHDIAKSCNDYLRSSKKVRVVVDVDPYSML
jgi:primosomal protein N' (replication factor Y)